jgi:hypothetical protein
MITRLLCFFNIHYNEIIPAEICYYMVDGTGLFTENQLSEINIALHNNKRKTFYYRCKRCGKEKEVGT